ncbi:DUF3501 family protein [Parasphingopyxis algicola]|uniref:DUF3501 family protein n=1 Tax=Parasphingopyxis algicola TaxID=2026624 RepID=UPI0015A04C9B|nr:DUF3501 family protein [Parasphingopyxis algicola]QLC25868.1 DUF3501 family protein [Parasphingopyxis algicola]
MPRNSREITAEDIMGLEDYEQIRAEKREENLLRKRFRRIAVGPHVTVYFESWDTMWLQVQEMLRIEKGGEEQLVDELQAYNPMIPDGDELTCTLMFEIEDPGRRDALLHQLGGVIDHIHLVIDSEKIGAMPEQDVDRESDSGKASSVLFLHFPFTAEQKAKFRDPANRLFFQIDHPAYGHAAIIGEEMRNELAKDFA